MIYVLLISLLLYVILLMRMRGAWLRTPATLPADYTHGVTIVIVFRNEKDHLETLLDDIANQDFNMSEVEILLINDDSTDNSVNVIKRWQSRHSLRIEIIDLYARTDAHKKEGIELGLAHAHYNHVLLTDADCRLPRKWIRCMITTEKFQLRCGPVCFIGGKSLWNRALELEMISLSAMAASTIAMRKPILSNGANMAYSRNLFWETGGYHTLKGAQAPSGDDIDFMRQVDRFSHSNIRYVKNADAIVETYMPTSLKEFFQQRIRWAGKTRFDLLTKGADISLILMLFYMSLFFTPFVLIFNYSPLLLWTWIAILFIKFMFDRMYFAPVLDFFNRKHLMRFLIVAEILHLIYIVPVAILSLFLPYTWKGRRLGHG
ncbi:MAG: glycosyltransferase [Bacteroidetes bacterium]|nr:glycosyltransferase [Bacteroidota bacterium]